MVKVRWVGVHLAQHAAMPKLLWVSVNELSFRRH